MQLSTISQYTETRNNLYLFDELIKEHLIIKEYQLDIAEINKENEVLVQVSMNRGSMIQGRYHAIIYQDIIILKPFDLNNTNALAIRTEFVYFSIIKDKHQEKIGFQLKRKEINITLLIDPQYTQNEKKNIIREWTRQLNKYVIRTDSLKKYCAVEPLGQGSQAKVYKVFSNKPNKLQDEKSYLAVKIFDKGKLKTQLNKNQVLNEIRNQRALKDCDQVLKIHKVYENEKFLNIIMEFAEQGSLSSYIKEQSITPSQSVFIVTQLLQGINCMNQQNIIHSDLKPQNILITKITDEGPLIKIADFGYSIINYSAKDEESPNICGTPGYFAPEVLKKYQYSKKSDIFSAGVILYNMLTRRCLIRGSTPQKAIYMNQQFNEDALKQSLLHVNQEFRLLLSSMLSQASDRITAKNALNLFQIRSAITHSKYLGNPQINSKFQDNDFSMIKDETRGVIVSSVEFIQSNQDVTNNQEDFENFLMKEEDKKMDNKQSQKNIVIKLDEGENTKVHEMVVDQESPFDFDFNSITFDECLDMKYDMDQAIKYTNMEKINVVHSFRQILQYQ